jgi:hypothetical protein
MTVTSHDSSMPETTIKASGCLESEQAAMAFLWCSSIQGIYGLAFGNPESFRLVGTVDQLIDTEFRGVQAIEAIWHSPETADVERLTLFVERDTFLPIGTRYDGYTDYNCNAAAIETTFVYLGRSGGAGLP